MQERVALDAEQLVIDEAAAVRMLEKRGVVFGRAIERHIARVGELAGVVECVHVEPAAGSHIERGAFRD